MKAPLSIVSGVCLILAVQCGTVAATANAGRALLNLTEWLQHSEAQDAGSSLSPQQELNPVNRTTAVHELTISQKRTVDYDNISRDISDNSANNPVDKVIRSIKDNASNLPDDNAKKEDLSDDDRFLESLLSGKDTVNSDQRPSSSFSGISTLDSSSTGDSGKTETITQPDYSRTESTGGEIPHQTFPSIQSPMNQHSTHVTSQVQQYPFNQQQPFPFQNQPQQTPFQHQPQQTHFHYQPQQTHFHYQPQQTHFQHQPQQTHFQHQPQQTHFQHQPVSTDLPITQHLKKLLENYVLDCLSKIPACVPDNEVRLLTLCEVALKSLHMESCIEKDSLSTMKWWRKGLHYTKNGVKAVKDYIFDGAKYIYRIFY